MLCIITKNKKLITVLGSITVAFSVATFETQCKFSEAAAKVMEQKFDTHPRIMSLRSEALESSRTKNTGIFTVGIQEEFSFNNGKNCTLSIKTSHILGKPLPTLSKKNGESRERFNISLDCVNS